VSSQRFAKTRQAPLHAPEPEAPDPNRDIDAERRERAIQWQREFETRAAICAGLSHDDCTRALLKAGLVSEAYARHLGVTP
jgi:hypothetical protein